MICKKCGNIPHYTYTYNQWQDYLIRRAHERKITEKISKNKYKLPCEYDIINMTILSRIKI